MSTHSALDLASLSLVYGGQGRPMQPQPEDDDDDQQPQPQQQPQPRSGRSNDADVLKNCARGAQVGSKVAGVPGAAIGCFGGAVLTPSPAY